MIKSCSLETDNTVIVLFQIFLFTTWYIKLKCKVREMIEKHVFM